MIRANNCKNADLWLELQASFGKYLQGDSDATQFIFGEISRILIPFFVMRTKSSETSEDLAQATLLKIHFARERFDPQLASLKTWVFTIAGRCLIDHWRGINDEVLFEDEHREAEIIAELPSGDLDAALKFEFNKDLNQALNLLKPNDRMTVYLYAVEGFSMGEIAVSMRLSEAAVKVRAHRSYVELRKLLGVTVVFIFILWKGFR